MPASRSEQNVTVRLVVNDRAHELEADAGETLLATLRDRLGLTGPKEACGEGECGACTVLVDGGPVASCILAAGSTNGRAVRTVEGLAGAGDLTTLQQAFVRHAAVQCGYCTPGVLMVLTALLEEVSEPTEAEVRQALAGNICRCTGYQQIVEAAVDAARAVAS
ncbi:MAG: (2Fe-2S)-binding protein [Acidimicrobiales bacterium]|nr:(2Fe-2S)-binding protein [Acidimicrobiaceae bacterium]MXV88439.1 (2Fe-2S)-binding protein [Acidimicrobiales bacterium]MDE0319929.1 (2Fe-2S)-binding protein [Acidimicrobiaceae bacterium]MXX43532.1 (2Fe-2S)-binding protein [Acidimicrobiales bacterium]MYB82917.1 (2Fe-2S)-binding protein [Acidimicrobiales bacterium]